MLGDTSAAERMVREWQERATERAAKFHRMSEQVEQISVTESSRDGAVSVTINSNGILQEVQLAENAGNRPMSQLSAEIMRTVQVAQSRIPELLQQAVADTVGEDDTAGQHIVGQVRKRFPEPLDDDEPAPRPPGVQEMDYSVGDDYEPPVRPSRPAPRRRPDDDDVDDYGSGSFLR